MSVHRKLVAGVGIVLAGALVVGGPAVRAEEPKPDQNIEGKTVYLAKGARLRYEEGLLSRVYTHTRVAAMKLEGRGRCSNVACPVFHNKVAVFARRARLDFEAPKDVPVVSERTLRRGDEGDDVKAMQEVLNKKGKAQVKVDGSYGRDMEEAVKEFQRASGLGVDGEIGAQTREKLRI